MTRAVPQRVYLGTDPVTGKQRYATRTIRGDKRDAQRVLTAMVAEAEQGLTVRTTHHGRPDRGLVRTRDWRLLAQDRERGPRLHRS